MTPVDYDFLCKLLKERSGLVLTPEKEYLAENRLLPVARRAGCATLTELDDADIADFAASLVRVLRAFAARGLWSFNLCLMPDAFGAAPPRHWLTARLLPRLY